MKRRLILTSQLLGLFILATLLSNLLGWFPFPTQPTALAAKPITTASPVTTPATPHMSTAATVNPFLQDTPTIIGETGQETVQETVANTIQTVNLTNTYNDPVVVAFINANNSGEPVDSFRSIDVRIFNVTSNSFQWFIERADGTDHIVDETISYIVMEKGRHITNDSLVIEAGSIDTAAVHRNSNGNTYSGSTINFQAPFAATPVLLHSFNTYNNGEFMATMAYDLSTTQFEVIQEAGGTGNSVTIETIGWIAFEKGSGTTNGSDYEIDSGMSQLLFYNFIDISFTSFSTPPDVVVKGNSNAMSHGFWARGQTHTASNQRAATNEANSDQSHTDPELFAWAAFDPNTTFTSGPCFVDADGDNAPDFAGDAQALRDAVAAATPGDTLRIAGTCAGVDGTSVIRLTKDINLIGGYNPFDWAAPPDPDAYPTILDAQESGRVVDGSGNFLEITLTNLIIQYGVHFSSVGGAMNVYGDVTITNSIIRNSYSFSGGGGIYVWARDYENEAFTLIDSVVEDNFVTNFSGGLGGGIFVEETTPIIIQNSVFRRNSAWQGGGIHHRGSSATIEYSSIYSNTALNGVDAGIYATFSNNGFNITNSTISYNNGNGISFTDFPGTAAVMNINYTTIANNSGTGIAQTADTPANHTVTITNSLIADNGTDCTRAGGATLNTTGGYNLDSDATCVTAGVNNNITANNPGFITIGEYGGDTPTNPLGPGSPALNRIPNGVNGCGNPINDDQRTISRPQTGACDIGAFESQGFTLQLISGDGQSTLVNSAVAHPLVVAAISNVAYEPVGATGIITFTGPSSGASLNPVQQTAVLDTDGQAALTVTVNSLSGDYTVTAALYGTTSTVIFNLTNTANFDLACDTAALITALETATVVGSTVQINLADACTYTLTAVHTPNPDGYGAVGLPPIRGSVIITGNNATIQRDAIAAPFRLLYLADTAVLHTTSLTLKNGYAAGSSGVLTTDSGGGAILNRGTLHINRATWHQNQTGDGHGGALFNLGGNVVITHATFAANSVSNAGYGGAIFNKNGTLQLQYNTVASNTASNEGGALYNYGGSASLTLVGTLLADSGNSNQDCVNNGGSVSTSNSLIESHNGCGNGSPIIADPLLGTFGDYSGGLHTFPLQLNSPALDAITPNSDGCNTTFTVDQRGQSRPFDRGCDIGAFEEVAGFCFVALNGSTTTAYRGNWGDTVQTAVAVASPDTLLKIAGTCIDTTTQAGTDQTIYIDKALTLAGGYDEDDWSAGAHPATTPTTLDALQNGRVLHIDTTTAVTVRDITLTGGNLTTAPYDGAGIFNNGAALTLTNLTLTDNHADRCGGAIYNDAGALTLTSSTIMSNTADLEWEYFRSCGGGLSDNQGTMHIISSTVAYNTVGGQGGAFYTEGGTVHISNSTLSGNQAGTGSAGYARLNGTVRLTATTIVSNTAVFENSLDKSSDSTISFKQTIIGQNSGGSCPTQLSDLGYNLSDDSSCVPNLTSLTSAITLLPLQDNGGDTWTHALPSGSPAIDGVPAAIGTQNVDQRGTARPQGVNQDIGAYEYVGSGTAVAPTLSINATTAAMLTKLSWSDDSANCAFDLAVSTTPYNSYTPFVNAHPRHSYTYAGTMGKVNTNSFYQVTAYACGGMNTAASTNTVGEFDFVMTAGQ